MKIRFAVTRHGDSPDSHLHSFEFHGRFGGWIIRDPWIKIYHLDTRPAWMVLFVSADTSVPEGRYERRGRSRGSVALPRTRDRRASNEGDSGGTPAALERLTLTEASGARPQIKVSRSPERRRSPLRDQREDARQITDRGKGDEPEPNESEARSGRAERALRGMKSVPPQGRVSADRGTTADER